MEITGTCGNRWKYGKDLCARESDHIGPHRTTTELEAWSFHWFDNEGTPQDVDHGTLNRDLKTVYSFGDKITFTNNFGQKNQAAVVMSQDGNVLTVDYLGCQHEVTLDQLS